MNDIARQSTRGTDPSLLMRSNMSNTANVINWQRLFDAADSLDGRFAYVWGIHDPRRRLGLTSYEDGATWYDTMFARCSDVSLEKEMIAARLVLRIKGLS